MSSEITVQVRLLGVDVPLLDSSEITFPAPVTVMQILEAFYPASKLENAITLPKLGQSIFLFNQASIQLTDLVGESGELYILRPLGGG